MGVGVVRLALVGLERARLERRVSGRPGADGALGPGVVVVRLVVEVGCGVEGVRRRDWVG